MKIALTFPGCHRRGGIERVVLECANFLASRDHEVCLITSDWDKSSLSQNVEIHPVPHHASHTPLRLYSFASSSAKELSNINPKPDVHGAFGVESPSEGVFWVPSVHKAWLEVSASLRDWKGRLRQKANITHPVVLSMEKALYKGHRYKKLLALTKQVKDDIQRFYDVPDEDISILSNGYSQTEFNLENAINQRPIVRKELSYTDSDKVVIFVANEFERKGFYPLLSAIASLNNPDIHLLAVGRLDPGRYSAEITKFNMIKRVQFTGPTADVAKYYAASDIFALPTQYEAWGLVIVEAMGCGLPVLTSRLAGAAIAVQEGVTGELLDNPADIDEIAAKLGTLIAGNHASGLEIEKSVHNYSWTNILTRYEKHLAECAD